MLHSLLHFKHYVRSLSTDAIPLVKYIYLVSLISTYFYKKKKKSRLIQIFSE